MRHIIVIALLILMPVMAACEEKQAQPETVQSEPQQWIGQWNGPEGTYLKIEQAEGGYNVVIRNLDGEDTYSAETTDSGFTFTRDGVEENIRLGTGEESGMKWLAEKPHCLIARTGEGYCRDTLN